MIRNWWAALLPLCIFGGVVKPGYAESAADPALRVASLWASKYATEGRDNLDSGGIISLQGTAEWQRLALDVWYGAGDSESYEELNLGVSYSFEVGSLDAYLGYTRLEFLEFQESDNEFSAGIASRNLQPFVVALDYTYSNEAHGGFLEVSLRQENSFLDGQLTLEPYVVQGFDFGYASDAFDGPNHFQVGLDVALELTKQCSLIASIAHSWAHEDIRNDSRGDISWGSIGLAATF